MDIGKEIGVRTVTPVENPVPQRKERVAPATPLRPSRKEPTRKPTRKPDRAPVKK